MNKNLIATILIVLAIVTYFTVTEKIMADAKIISTVNDEYKAAIKSAEKLIAVRDQVREAYNRLSQEDRERLSKLIPGSVDNIRLLIDMESIARDNGLTLKNLQATAAESAKKSDDSVDMSGSNETITISTPTLDYVDISFSVTAPYQTFRDLLLDLESNLRLMDVSSLSVKASDTGIYDFDVKLKTYWLRQQ